MPTTDGFPVATTPAPGIAGVDWEVRVDFERLRTSRLARAKEALDASDAAMRIRRVRRREAEGLTDAVECARVDCVATRRTVRGRR